LEQVSCNALENSATEAAPKSSESAKLTLTGNSFRDSISSLSRNSSDIRTSRLEFNRFEASTTEPGQGSLDKLMI
jgi:hypothetical protein